MHTSGAARAWVYLATIFTTLSLALTVSAQSNAGLRGTVTDPTSAVLTGIEVSVHNEATGLVYTTKTNSVGSYDFPSLPVGSYEIRVTAPGMQTAVVKGFVLQVGQIAVRNFQLTVGTAVSQVEVSDAVTLIDTSSATVGQVINQKTVQEIPLNGRHFVDLSLLTPGTVTPPANGFLTAPLRGQGSFAFNTAGQREDTVNIMVNGINLNDMLQNQITFQPSINTVAEFKVDNSTYSAQYGRNSGAIVNIATRSGTNQFHGEAFELLRNEKLDARNYFSLTRAPFKRNNFGAAVGGPIVKNRAHFFLSYEGLRQRQGITINSLVLDDAQRTQALASGDAAIQKLLPFIPSANSVDPKGNPVFLGAASAPVNIDQGTGDVDVDLTTKDRLHGYYALQQDLRQEPILQGNTLPNWGDTRQSRRQIMTLNEDHIFSNTLTNTIRLGYNRIHITFQPNRLLNSADFDINNGITAPIGLAQIDVGGFALDFGGPSGFPQGRGDTAVALSDTVNYLHGRHAFAIGGEVRRAYNNNFSQDTTIFRFADVPSFIADQVTSFTYLGTSANRILYPSYSGFIEDTFKVRSNLTLQLGLRYDWLLTPTEADNRFVVFDPATSTLHQIGTSGFSQPFPSGNKNFQPRVGFIWDLRGDGKSVLRAGYAILADQPVTGIVTGLNSNPPFTQPLTSTAAGLSLVNAATVAGPSGLAPNTINGDFKNPYVQSWNLNLQQELSHTVGLTIAYVGSKGTHLRVARNLNQFELENGALVRPFATLSPTSPIIPAACASTPTCKLGNITEVDSNTDSSYNGLWVTVNKHISHGLQFLASYAWSKSIDDNSLNSQTIILQNSLNVGNNRGLSDFDVRHRFVISGFYELPFHKNRLVNGWQLGLITQLQTGNPLNIVTTITRFTGTTGLGALRPDQLGPVSTTGSASEWFGNISNLAVPCTNPSDATTCHFGDMGRNSISGPSFMNTDFSAVKDTKLTERLNLQFRAEMFDIFNQANFGNPNLTFVPGSTTFGVIRNTRFPTGDFGSSRQIQFALKLQF
jgi:hypothetical protein